MYSLITSLSPSNTWGEEREPGNICMESCWLLDQALLIRLRNRIMCTHDNLSILSRNLKNQLVSTDYTSKGGEKQFYMCRRGERPKSLRTKSTVVDLRASEYRHPQKSIPDVYFHIKIGIWCLSCEYWHSDALFHSKCGHPDVKWVCHANSENFSIHFNKEYRH